MSSPLSASQKMPVVFLGHGSPLNGIADNRFTRALKSLGERLPRPKAVLCISAHWMTRGTWATSMPRPRTIHDFGGFPKELYEVQYPAPGSPELAEEIQGTIQSPLIELDDKEWGLDHGTWTVLRHVYPLADIPVIQLSLDMSQGPRYHFELGQKLSFLREREVLVVGSGNIVHNLRTIRWEKDAPTYPWAIEFDEWVKAKLLQKDFQAIVDESRSSEAGRMSIPTWEHWYPLLYILGAGSGAKDADDPIRFDYEGLENGSISMRCVSLG